VRYRGGVGNYLYVLDSESRLFSAELLLAQLELQQRLAETNLYAALGGGWQNAPGRRFRFTRRRIAGRRTVAGRAQVTATRNCDQPSAMADLPSD
jgi:hypothetical protein